MPTELILALLAISGSIFNHLFVILIGGVLFLVAGFYLLLFIVYLWETYPL